MTPDQSSTNNDPSNPGSWNHYAYVNGDPVNLNDPAGLFTEGDDGDDGGGDPGPGDQGGHSPGQTPVLNKGNTPYPECNKGDNPSVDNKINFIVANYGDAASEAAGITAAVGGNTNTLTTAFLQWSAWESHYGQDPGNIAENNYFGAQNKYNTAGAWNGAAIPCVRGGPGNPIPANSQNACFSSDLSWGQELGDLLNTASGKTGVTYLNALETGLTSNPNESSANILQSLANNGWNGRNYGSTVANGISIGGLIDCLKRHKYI